MRIHADPLPRVSFTVAGALAQHHVGPASEAQLGALDPDPAPQSVAAPRGALHR